MGDSQNKIINKLWDLYIIQRKKYLIQYPNNYSTLKAGELTKTGKKIHMLSEWHLQKHINGNFTIGTFGGVFKTKFMTFDVDFANNKDMSKWITYKISETLKELGVHNHYISFSGKKGYHIDLFFKDLIMIGDAKKFFNYILNRSDINQYFDDGNKVEFRPDSLGVKIPLGIHQLTKMYCGFCLVENGLKVMSREDSEKYLFSIKKNNSEVILDIIGEEKKDNIPKKEFIDTEDAIAQHKPLPSYKPSEDYSIDRAQNFLMEGLKIRGSRHNALKNIIAYFKYCGLEKEQAKYETYKWMEKQDPNTYGTPLNQCFKDIDGLIDYIYLRDYSIKPPEKDIAVTFDEIKAIINQCLEKNQKLLTYALLIHSKRFALKNGVFYMSFNQMKDTTGLGKATVFRQTDKLIKINVLLEEERNRKQKGKKERLPNKYILNLDLDANILNKDNDNMKLYYTQKYNDMADCLKFYFTEKELKKLFPRKQFEGLIRDTK